MRVCIERLRETIQRVRAETRAGPSTWLPSRCAAALADSEERDDAAISPR